VKVWGTFQFKGLEKSPLSGATSMMDLITFRELYGYLTPEKLAEIKQLQAATGAKEVKREDAEAALFGGDEAPVAQATPQAIDDAAEFGTYERVVLPTTFDQQRVEQGVVLNAAVVLKDPSKIQRTMKEIEAISEREQLGLKVVSWEKAAGILGDMTVAFRWVLIVAGVFVFLIAVVIIIIAIMMQTMQRVREIGTLRAIGTQKSFVLSMILVETIVLGIAFGAVGSLLGAVVMRWLHDRGIPATSDELYFFFSGPRLHPDLSVMHVVLAFSVVIVVATVSALYPAILAMRVQPVTAMQSAEE
jgi:hypothetical protein